MLFTRLMLLSGLSGLLISAASAALGPVPPDLYVPLREESSTEEKMYIVQLAEPPALSYRGRDGGLAATRPPPGKRFDPRDSRVRQYGEHLTESHDELLRSIGAYYSKVYSYRYTFNGFAARLTPLQAEKLRTRRSVLNVWEDRLRYLHTNDSPAFLGLFDQSGGLRADLRLKGEDVVIGVIDSGIAPEHPSFDDTAGDEATPRVCRSSWAENSLLGLWLCRRFKIREDRVAYSMPADWNGSCEAGDSFAASDCNNKLIGARFYIDGFLETNFLDENEFISPRDADGHGTHIASTAAGGDVRANLGGTDIARIVGMAPRARIAVYKACWLEPGQMRGSCSTSDLQRAIEDAVADGVDIINYSVGNTDVSISDPDDLALLAASNAGVLSVVAAGNDGPAPGTILSPAGAPWVITVGASSRTGRRFDEAIRVNAPTNIATDYMSREASFTPPLKDEGPITEELILVDDDVAGVGTTYDACETIVNDAELTNRIAFLQRGACTFEEKLRNVEDAGAIAAVVFDNQGDPIVMAGARDSVNIPAVMIGQADGQLILDELQDEDTIVEVTLDKSLFIEIDEDGDMMGSFSSRGPNLTALDILKPDVVAPGVNILAGQTPDVANGIRDEEFQYLSGTSMSVPHVAGIAALLKEAHPDWSPAAIKSALMTTARQDVLREDAETPADPLDVGSGHVVPNLAADPGLVYEAGPEDYDAFGCGLEQTRLNESQCAELAAAGFPTDPADLNVPSIALGNLVSERTVRRRITNIGDAAQYSVQIEAPDGVDVQVSPPAISLAGGETAEYEIRISGGGAELYDWAFGSLVWGDGRHAVYSPIAVRPVPFLAPVEVRGSGLSGNLSFEVRFGYSGAYTAKLHGLALPDVATGLVQDDALNSYVFQPDSGQLPASVSRFQFEVADDQTYLRVALFNDDTDGADDLDLYVYYCPGLVLCSTVGISGESDSDEQVDFLFPPTGEYLVDVHGFETDNTLGGLGAAFDLFVWILGQEDDRGNAILIAPDRAVAGEVADVSLQWQNLERQRYLGGITHSDATGPLEFTVIAIDN
jgi:subtilisin family serine protease